MDKVTMTSLRKIVSCIGRFNQARYSLFRPFNFEANQLNTRTPSSDSRLCTSAMRVFSTSPFEADSPLVHEEDFSEMSNSELEDTETIPGWNLIHSPPRKFPRGALVGTVVSDKMNKTVNVAVDRYRIVPKIRKKVKYTRKFMAHDEQEVANVGDMVMITPSHRISKRKHFMLREILRPKGQI